MAIEIERRFLVAGDGWQSDVPQHMAQGYLKADKDTSVRIRIEGEKASLTIKAYLTDISRHEFDYPIPLADAQTLLALCPFRLEKKRHHVWYQGHLFEVDEYLGENGALLVAEIELSDEHAPFPRPDWLGEEITHDGRYSNAYLSRHPYHTWANQADNQAT